MKVQLLVTLDVQPSDDGSKVPWPGEPGWDELARFLCRRVQATLQNDVENDLPSEWDALLETNVVDVTRVEPKVERPRPRRKGRP